MGSLRRASARSQQQPSLTVWPGTGGRLDGAPCSRPTSRRHEGNWERSPRDSRCAASEMEKPDVGEREVTRPCRRKILRSSSLPASAAAAQDRNSKRATSRQEAKEKVEKLDEDANFRPESKTMGQRPRKTEGQEAGPLEGRQGCKEGKRQRQEVTRMTAEQWKSFMKEMSQACAKRCDLMGTCVRRALLHAPSSWGGSARQQHAVATAVLRNLALGPKPPQKQHGDLMPLPFCMSAEEAT